MVDAVVYKDAIELSKGKVFVGLGDSTHECSSDQLLRLGTGMAFMANVEMAVAGALGSHRPMGGYKFSST